MPPLLITDRVLSFKFRIVLSCLGTYQPVGFFLHSESNMNTPSRLSNLFLIQIIRTYHFGILKILSNVHLDFIKNNLYDDYSIMI